MTTTEIEWTHLYDADGKMLSKKETGQLQLGHSSIETTRKYITVLDESRGERIREVGDLY